MGRRKAQDDGLREYRDKRDFGTTPEPAGGALPISRSGRLYCVQKHHARHLHYDLRLELDGVLLSWAIPKGPSLDPSDKPLAVRTEDHPIEYGGFEGIIPSGAYGAGTVMLWDAGEWEPLSDPHDGLAKGDFKFRIKGSKLNGDFALARMKTAEDRAKGADGRNWLLIKKRDDHARSTDRYDILIEEPDSVVTHRSLATIEAEHDAEWRGGLTGGITQTKPSRAAHRDAGSVAGSGALDPGAATGSRRSEQPNTVRPMLAKAIEHAPDGDDWIHEIKHDGYRLLAMLERGRVRLRTRNGHDWTDRFDPVVRALERLSIRRAVLDGEVVILDEQGISNFHALQDAIGPRGRGASSGRGAPFVYLAFDLLHLNGWDLTKTPLHERKGLLERAFSASPGAAPTVRLSEHILGNGPLVESQARRSGVEGIISKRATSRYVQKRSDSWLKIKFPTREEFVIAGYKEPEGARSWFGSLVLARYDSDGSLIYNGRVGTGFDEPLLESIGARLLASETRVCPVANPPTGADAARLHWVEPVMVCEVSYDSFTDEGMLRFPVFVAMREDKPASEVVCSSDAGPTPPEPAPIQQSVRPARSDVVRAPQKPDDDRIEGVRLSNPNRIVYPDPRLSKRDVASYMVRVAARMLPHIADRPISVVRCPKGVHHEHFFQRHPAEGMPEAIRAVHVDTGDGPEGHLMIHDLAGLLSLVQFGALEFHVWGCRADRPDRPDRIIFDLDPDDTVPGTSVVDGAFFIRDLLADAGLDSVVKTTGGKGFHIGVAIARRSSWQDVHAFSKSVAERAATLAPELFTASLAKRLRAGRIFIDYLRNTEGATAVAPYSMRARPGATVSLPLRWEQLARSTRPDGFDIRTVPDELEDPWTQPAQTLTSAIRRRAAGG